MPSLSRLVFAPGSAPPLLTAVSQGGADARIGPRHLGVQDYALRQRIVLYAQDRGRGLILRVVLALADIWNMARGLSALDRVLLGTVDDALFHASVVAPRLPPKVALAPARPDAVAPVCAAPGRLAGADPTMARILDQASR